jgi:Prion-inhibition and propagation
MNVAGLVIGVVSLWKTCVEIFEVIDSGRKYGMEYEILRVKLEVERIRLVTWGNALGLSEVEHGRPTLHARLNQDDVRDAVLRLLGCIQHVFENTERLQGSYGLRPVTPTPHNAGDEGRPTQSQLILGPIFKRSYKTLLELARYRQNSTPLHKKTIWAIHNKKKFGEMISEIKGFNDNLESLFPDIKGYTFEDMRNEINQSEDIDALQSLEEATMNQHEDISSAASDRLEVMGVSSVARSRISGDQHIITGETNSAPQPGNANVADADAEPHAESDASEELKKKMDAVELYTSSKCVGALTLSLIGPHRHSARVSAHVGWEGRQSDDTSSWDDLEKGFVKNSHASFGQSSILHWQMWTLTDKL